MIPVDCARQRRPTDMKPEHFHVLAATVFATRVGPVTSTTFDRWLLGRIQQGVAGARIQFLLWDGFELPSKAGPPVATVVIKNRRVLFDWVWNPDLHFGEAYMFGAIEVRGDLVALLEEIYRARADSLRRPSLLPGPPTIFARRNTTFITTTTSATSSIDCGWIETWSTRAHTSHSQTVCWTMRSWRRWIWCVESCG